MALQWHDKRVVTMMTTMHENKMLTRKRKSRFTKDKQKIIQKPLCIDEYNKYMGGVYKSD